MKDSTIRDYFLRAGASFRNCDTWAKEYTDAQGRPEVPRSGRFGVGAFAAFLLGSEIGISTRHVTEPVGYTFVARKDTEIIEIRRVPDSYMGTTIKLLLHQGAVQRNSARICNIGRIVMP